ncbi:MAG: DUF4238 domain-containing protein [Eubacterium sp.]|nr:DUF4238 domain-containing protein [Eubacterium sp.]
MKDVNIKHKQHYVFQAYLEKWSNNKQIWCCRKDKIFLTNIINVAQERDFYRIKELNSEEEKFISLFLFNQPKDVREAVTKHIQLLHKQLMWKELSDTFINNISFCIEDNQAKTELNKVIENLRKIADSGVNDLVENIYSDDEGKAIVYLNQIINEDLSFFYSPDSDDCFRDSKQRFIHFLCTQHFRTKSARVRWENGMSESFNEEILNKLGVDYSQLRPNHLAYYVFWYVENHVADMLYNNAHLSLIINNTEEPFITSDQPIINIKANYQSINDTPDELIFYYPISPKYAILLNDNSTDSRIIALDKDVEYYNTKITKSALENIFANDKALFEKYHF